MATELSTALLADKKKISKKIRNLKDAITKGSTQNNTEGSNSVFEKAYYALKDTPKIPLAKVDISMFGEYGFLRAGNFYIAKSQNSFSLFKARENLVLPDKQERVLLKKAKEIVEKVGTNEKKMLQITSDVPFLKWKPLGAKDIAVRLYQESKKDKKLYDAVSRFVGKEKLLKKDFEALNYGEMLYIVENEGDKIKHTDFYKACEAYHLKGVKDELRLKRGADTEIITSEALRGIKKEVDVIESNVYSLQSSLMVAKENKSPNRSAKILSLTMELLECKKDLENLEGKLEKLVADPDEEQILSLIQNVQSENGGKYEDGGLQYVSKDELQYAQKHENPRFMKIGLADKSTVIDFFTGEGCEFAQELNVEIEKNVIITNYGVFSDAKADKALENLLSYAKSMNEMVKDNDIQEQKVQEQSGNFAI